MVILKTNSEIALMKQACRISAQALKLAGESVKPGVSTFSIDKIVYDFIKSCGAEPNFLNLYGFPATSCISLNDGVIHGIPKKDIFLKEGDIVSIDLGAKYKGYNGDNARTFPVGKISKEAEELIKVTEKALYLGIEQAIVGNRVGDVSHAIQAYCESKGYGVVKEYTGHGIGKSLHEDPAIPNFGKKGRGQRLVSGMTIAIEPMINQGTSDIASDKDSWNTRTKDGKLSAHFEHTIVITDDGPIILTQL